MRWDTDNDGKLSDAEKSAGLDALGQRVAAQLKLEVAGKPLPLTLTGPAKLSPDLSQTFHFTAQLPALPEGETEAKLVDEFSRTQPGDYRFRPEPPGTAPVQVEATAPPGSRSAGSHPSMIVLPLKLRVSRTLPASTQPARKP